LHNFKLHNSFFFLIIILISVTPIVSLPLILIEKYAIQLTLMGAGRVQLVQQLGYCLDSQGTLVQFLVGVRNFSLLYNIQTGSRAHLTSYTIGAGGCFAGDKPAGA
jgi:hypothetical protein